MTITEFLTARLAEREYFARQVLDADEMWSWESYVGGAGMFDEPAHVFAEENHPARILRDCAALRAIVERHRSVDTVRGNAQESVLREVLAHLAAAYADHPDYDASWRP